MQNIASASNKLDEYLENKSLAKYETIPPSLTCNHWNLNNITSEMDSFAVLEHAMEISKTLLSNLAIHEHCIITIQKKSGI